MKFQLLIKAKLLKNNYSSCRQLFVCAFILLISSVEHEKSFMTLEPRLVLKWITNLMFALKAARVIMAVPLFHLQSNKTVNIFKH